MHLMKAARAHGLQVVIVIGFAFLSLAGCKSESSSPGRPGPQGSFDAEPPDAEPEPDAEPYEARPPRPDAPPNSLNVRACRTLQMGTVAPVMGQALFNMDAPTIASNEQIYRVALPPRMHGHVTFTAPAAGEYVFFASTTAALVVFDISGGQIEIKALRLKIPECVQVNGRHAVDLDAGKYVIRLGPEMAGSVDVVVVPAAP